MPTGSHRWYVDRTIKDLEQDRKLYLALTPVPLLLGVALLVSTAVFKVTTKSAEGGTTTDPLANLFPVLTTGGGTLLSSALLVPLSRSRKCRSLLRKWQAQSILLQECCESDPVDEAKCAAQRKAIEDLMKPGEEPS